MLSNIIPHASTIFIYMYKYGSHPLNYIPRRYKKFKFKSKENGRRYINSNFNKLQERKINSRHWIDTMHRVSEPIVCSSMKQFHEKLIRETFLLLLHMLNIEWCTTVTRYVVDQLLHCSNKHSHIKTKLCETLESFKCKKNENKKYYFMSHSHMTGSIHAVSHNTTIVYVLRKYYTKYRATNTNDLSRKENWLEECINRKGTIKCTQ